MSEIQKHGDRQVENDEIDLLALGKTIWSKRRLITYIVLIFIGVGLFVAIFSSNEFTASTTFIPQSSDSNRGGGALGGLASLAGVNIGNTVMSAEIPPSLYPKITSSVPFKKALLEAKVTPEELGEEVTFKSYILEHNSPGILSLVKKYTIGLPGVLMSGIKGEKAETITVATNDGLIRITREEYDIFRIIDASLSVTPNDKEGFVALSFTMSEPLMAAQMANQTKKLLQSEVIAYKLGNAKEQLKFTEERFAEKKEEFEKIQNRLASFRDRNQNIASAAAMNQQDRMEAEYNFVFNVYTELAKQVEQAKLQVAKDTPVFSVIEPVSVPNERSAPKRPLIIIIFTVLGFIVALAYVFGSEFLKGVKEQWKEV
ncbi:Wzz/FepE/Etk N-terminal domain-containing protein [Belliella sp. DSM 111904]|uniref:Wzz/FepE/Etk N-terminal domain-containing protein n=1 Tax=Belliella filtrata TaxID=2923435 RepID=A0ABS9V0Z3_9BACT|nr:Wzz/FepE/Etk N-terminal domain-containing protein [Belliella filtrata]MCH7409673.1 Wzz/FepE/Etk N-terminal domain-containing protein [Belliella filtrata]